ncbi:phage tail protein [Herbaspirillum huttiense]|uniref:phage tail protein n=1 Tax=Herbaspirillum huttiense TaxID=863372 RepID=UPI0039AFFCF7
MEAITVYQADSLGFYLYSLLAHELAMQPGSFNVPYGAKLAPPPATEPGYVARSSGPEEWTVVEDHRKEVLFYEKTPAAGDAPAVFAQYEMSSVVEIGGMALRYDGGGEIPAWLTATPPAPAEAPVGA